jgi:hypothetical protein
MSGLAEENINLLAQIPGLKVIVRTLLQHMPGTG